MERNKIFSILILVICFTVSSCKKYGCTDPEAIDYDAKAEKSDGCKFYLANGVAINSIPEVDETGKVWDENGAPDLYAKIYAQDGSVSHESILVNDFLSMYLPTDDFKLTNKAWKIELWDKDAPEPDKLMFTAGFEPTSGQNDRIPIKSGDFDVTLQYFVLEEK